MEKGAKPAENAKLNAVVFQCDTDFFSTYGYKRIQILGRGMTGSVVLAMPSDNRGTLRALKTFNKKSRDEWKKSTRYFLREVAILQSIEHKHIMGNTRAFECPDEYILCMPYFMRGNLREFLSKSNLSIPMTKEYMQQLTSAVNYLHTHQLIHRDIKAENILLSDEGYIILSDFGLACQVGTKSCKRLCGTREYMAPELLKQPLPENIDFYKCDMYSMGVLFCKMMMGTSTCRDDCDSVASLQNRTIPGFYKSIGENLLHGDSGVRWDSEKLKEMLTTYWPPMTDLMDCLDC